MWWEGLFWHTTPYTQRHPKQLSPIVSILFDREILPKLLELRAVLGIFGRLVDLIHTPNLGKYVP